MAELTELVTKFLFKGSLDPLKKYNGGIGQAVKGLAIFSTSALAAGTAIAAFVNSSAEAMEGQISLSKQTGVSVEKIRELTYAAGQFGISAGTVESNIGSLSKKIGEAATTGSIDFARLGISARDSGGHVKDVSEILDDLRSSFKRLGLSTQQKVSFSENMGLDANFVQVLDLSDKKFKDLIKTARSFGTVSEKQSEALESINQNMATLSFGFKSLRTQIAVGLAPVFKDLSTSLTDFMREHAVQITSFFQGFGGAILDVAAAVKRLTPFVATAVAGFVAWRIAAVGVAEAIGVILSPAVLIGAAIAAILLAVDDLIVAFKGGDSVLKEWVKDLKEFLGLSSSKTMTLTKKEKTEAAALKTLPLPMWGIPGAKKGMPPSPAAHITQHVSINVKSTDPVQTGIEIKKELNKHLRQAQSNFAGGGI